MWISYQGSPCFFGFFICKYFNLELNSWIFFYLSSRSIYYCLLCRCRKNMDMEPHELEIFPVAEIFYPCIQVAALLSQKVVVSL